MRFTYPNGLDKALTFSYDDGRVFDRKLVEIFNRYGVKGTFHLNSGTLGQKAERGDFVTPQEVKELYQGHEGGLPYGDPFAAFGRAGGPGGQRRSPRTEKPWKS